MFKLHNNDSLLQCKKKNLDRFGNVTPDSSNGISSGKLPIVHCHLLTSDTSDSLTDVFFISQVTRSDTIQL